MCRYHGFLNAQNISNDHPTVEILHDVETTAYYVDENLSGYILVQFIIQAILRRVTNMLNWRLNVSAFYFILFFLKILTQLPTSSTRVWLSFQRWFDWTSVSFDEQNLSGNVIHNETWKDDSYYYEWTLPRSTWTYSVLSDFAVQDCTLLELASLDIGGR